MSRTGDLAATRYSNLERLFDNLSVPLNSQPLDEGLRVRSHSKPSTFAHLLSSVYKVVPSPV